MEIRQNRRCDRIFCAPGPGPRKSQIPGYYSAAPRSQQLCLCLPCDETETPERAALKLVCLALLHDFFRIGLFYPIVWRFFAWVVRPTEIQIARACVTLGFLTKDYSRRLQKAKRMYNEYGND